MKIGRKTKEPLPTISRKWGKYAELWAKVSLLKKGEHIPVTCDDEKEARNLYCAAQTHRTQVISVARRGLVVYLSYEGNKK